MKTTIRKIGNSAGAILPSPILKKLHLSEGDPVEVTVKGDAVIISPFRPKHKYKLEELLKQCDMKAPKPTILSEWDEIEPVGQEPW